MIVKQRFKILRFITFLQSFIPPWKFQCAEILSLLPPFSTVYPFTPHRLSLVVLIWVDRKVKNSTSLPAISYWKGYGMNRMRRKIAGLFPLLCVVLLYTVSSVIQCRYLWWILIIVFGTKIVFILSDRIPLIKMIFPLLVKSYHRRDTKTETWRNTRGL